MDTAIKIESEISAFQENLKDRISHEQLLIFELSKRSLDDLKKDENALKSQLEELKKENFALEISVKSWQKTLEKKIEEYKQIELKLVSVHNKIWSAREEFCDKADKFCEEYGILSPWWKEQMDFVTELEKLGEKKLDEKKVKEEIEQLQMKLFNVKKTSEKLESTTMETDNVFSTVNENCLNNGDNENFTEEVKLPSEMSEVEVPESTENEIDVPSQDPALENELYTLMDLEKFKLARKKSSQNKKHLLQKVKKFLKPVTKSKTLGVNQNKMA